MTLIITVYTQEGIVMAADSRLSLNTSIGDGAAKKDISFDFSNATQKVFCSKRGLGISTSGDAGINDKPIAGYLEQFISQNENEPPEQFSIKLLADLKTINPNLATSFHVCGYDARGEQRIFTMFTKDGVIKDANPKKLQGAVWNGEIDILSRIVLSSWQCGEDGKPSVIFPYYAIPWNFFSLQDAIDFATFAMTATIGAIRFQNRLKTVGGPVDLLVIKPASTEWVQRKSLRA